jgi:hypothetical protein
VKRFKYLKLVPLGVVAGLGAAAMANAAGVFSPARAVTPPPEPVAPIGTLGAFERPQTASERAVRAIPAVAEALRALGAGGGSVDTPAVTPARDDGLRVLLTGLGESNRMVFAFRSRQGAACLGLTDFTSGCLSELPRRLPATVTYGDPDAERIGEPLIVWGYARADVTAVSVVAAGSTYEATVGGNAYFFQARSNAIDLSQLEAVVAHVKGGREVRLPITNAQPRLTGWG